MMAERRQSGGEAALGSSVPRDRPLYESPDDVRAELSDARRSILHRQERDALAVLAARQGQGGDALASQTQENLLLRADLLELSALKQSRDMSTLREVMRHQGSIVDRISGMLAGVPAGKADDPRNVENLHARLEVIERWVLTASSKGQD